MCASNTSALDNSTSAFVLCFASLQVSGLCPVALPGHPTHSSCNFWWHVPVLPASISVDFTPISQEGLRQPVSNSWVEPTQNPGPGTHSCPCPVRNPHCSLPCHRGCPKYLAPTGSSCLRQGLPFAPQAKGISQPLCSPASWVSALSSSWVPKTLLFSDPWSLTPLGSPLHPRPLHTLLPLLGKLFLRSLAESHFFTLTN